MVKFFVIMLFLSGNNIVNVGVEQKPYDTIEQCTEAASKELLAMAKMPFPEEVTEFKAVCLPVTVGSGV